MGPNGEGRRTPDTERSAGVPRRRPTAAGSTDERPGSPGAGGQRADVPVGQPARRPDRPGFPLPPRAPRFLTACTGGSASPEPSFLIVAEGRGRIVGFIAGSTDVAGLYRSFLRRDGFGGRPSGRPASSWGWRQVLETLRHGSSGGAGAGRGAELLAVAVDPAWQGRGVGGELVAAFLERGLGRGPDAAHVVVAADNGPAVALYRRAGFVVVERFELHAGTVSLLMQWDRPDPERRPAAPHHERPGDRRGGAGRHSGGHAAGHRRGRRLRDRRPTRRAQAPVGAGPLPGGGGRLRRRGGGGGRRPTDRAGPAGPGPGPGGGRRPLRAGPDGAAGRAAGHRGRRGGHRPGPPHRGSPRCSSRWWPCWWSTG